MTLFDFTLRKNGFPIDKAREEYKHIAGLSTRDLKQFQENAKFEMFEWHLKNNPAYKAFIGDREIANWSDVPVLDRSFFQRNQHPFAKSYSRDNVYWGKTSGSSGRPMYYAKDKFTHALTWVDIEERYRQVGIDYGKDLQARFYGIPLEGITYYRERIKDLISKRRRFVVYDMSDKILDGFIERFKSKAFIYVYGYTNSILLFCRYLNNKELTLKQLCPSLTCCIVTSEVCTPFDSAFISENLGVKVVNEYGCSELGVLAMHDAHGDWAMNRVCYDIEILDDDNRVLPENHVGKIVATSLFNKAMPFVRYEIGDRGAISWVDGKLVLHSLEGRLNDIIYLPSGKIVPGFTLYYVVKALMGKMDGVREYKIWQKSLLHIHFEISMTGELDKSLVDQIEKVTERYLEKGLIVTVSKVDRLQRTGAGKMKHFESLL